VRFSVSVAWDPTAIEAQVFAAALFECASTGRQCLGVSAGSTRVSNLRNIYIVVDDIDVDISDSFFGYLTPVNHSAVVHRKNGWGGAIAKVQQTLRVTICCFRECRAAKYDMAITMGNDPCGKINDTIFECCGNSEIADGQGTLLHEVGISGLYYHLNFSHNHLSRDSGAGCAFDAGWTWGDRDSNKGRWDIYFCTFLKCTFLKCGGKSIIQVDTDPPDNADRSSIQFCNFFGNEPGSSGAIVWVHVVGVYLRSCIFGPQAHGAVLHRETVSPADQNCFKLIHWPFPKEVDPIIVVEL
jgi:hypothetical protein